MPDASDLCAELSDLAAELDALGCTDDEVERVRVDQGGTLPASYRCFLMAMGRDAGGLFGGTDVCYPEVLGLRAAASSVLDVYREDHYDVFRLPEDAVVVSMHQGYAFEFVRCSAGDDPPVEWWAEGMPNPASAGRSASSIIEWLRQDLTTSALPPELREQYRRETQAFLRLRYDQPRCPRCGGACDWVGEARFLAGDPDSGRSRLIGTCQVCGSQSMRWADDPMSPLTPSSSTSKPAHTRRQWWRRRT